MEVQVFDIKKGIFHFRMQALNATSHAHPVMEFIFASQGSFTLHTQNTAHAALKFAVIDANMEHQLSASNSSIEILMLESNNSQLKEYLNILGIRLSDGLFISKEVTLLSNVIEELKQFAQTRDLKKVEDSRVDQSLVLMESNDLVYHLLIAALKERIFLSESRLSHLFKQHIGVSIKKYFVWSRLKNAIHFMLNEKVNFTTAAHQSGFYDQAHLSNAFKKFLGVNPSKAYNSRTLQF